MSTLHWLRTAPETVDGLAPRPTARDVGDPGRLALIRRLDLRGHLGAPDLEAIVSTVVDGCRVPIVAVTVVTPHLQTYVAELGAGTPARSMPDDQSFCAEVVRTGSPLAVSDARAHPVYATNPLVADGSIGSYAGQPLRVGGRVIGVLSMSDSAARVFSDQELGILHAQARLAETVLQLRALTTSDLLTGLATRSLLLEQVAAELLATRPSGLPVGVLVLEVCGMASINEQHGSDVGNLVLRAIADRITASCTAVDVVARIGGDTMAVLWKGVCSVGDARVRAAAVGAAAAAPLEVSGAQVDVVVRHGLATATAGTADALLAAAARQAGVRPPVAEPGHADALRVAELRAAIELDQLVLHYHPVVELASGRLVAVEALVRWQHPDGRLVPPLDFIPLAEESGLIVELGDWVLRAAGSQASAWAAAGRVLDVAVNLSPVQMSRPDFAEHVVDTLGQVKAPLSHVVLEVTESALLDDTTATAALWALREEGVRLALDDFGTGYASFSYLRRFPIDMIKIDRSFVAGLGLHPDDDAIVGSIVSLARRTGKTVVAEGVETGAQAAALGALGVELAQGFLWTPPLPAHQVSAWADAPDVVRRATVPPKASAGPEPAEARIQRMHVAGASLHTIAAALNSTGLRTVEGTRWHVRSVARSLGGSPGGDRASA